MSFKLSSGTEQYFVDTEKLIDVVRTRPFIYSKQDEQYNGCARNDKANYNAWRSVCKELIKNFDELKTWQQSECVAHIKKRWRNLRTCFTREMFRRKKERVEKAKGRTSGKYRRPYIYFDKLKFLMKPNAEEELDDDISDQLDDESENYEDMEEEYDGIVKQEDVLITVEPSEEDNPLETVHFNNDTEIDLIEHNSQPILIDKNNKQSCSNYKDDTVESTSLDLLKEFKKQEDDDVKQFALSLVPSLKKLNDEQLMEAKIEIWKTIRRVMFQGK